MNSPSSYLNFLSEVTEKHPSLANDYVDLHKNRISKSIAVFDLQKIRHSSILEIGPYLAMTPIYYALNGNSVHIVDGDSNEVMQMETIYRDYGISSNFLNFERSLKDTTSVRLPYNDNEFDHVVCWETIEHFNFNPIPFISELIRVTKNGGNIYITVPNQTKLHNRVKIILGQSILEPIVNFHRQLDTTENFTFGLHWKEYTLTEVIELVKTNQSSIVHKGHFNVFENKKISLLRKVARTISTIVSKLIPSTRSNCYVHLTKTEPNS